MSVRLQATTNKHSSTPGRVTLNGLMLMMLLLAACQGTLEPTPHAAASTPATQPANTPAAQPTRMPSATAAPAPSATSTPTTRPTATATPSLTPTMAPTHTPLPTPTSATAQRYRMRYEIEHPTVLGKQTLVDQLWLPLPNTEGDGTREMLLIEVYPAGHEIQEIGGENLAVYWSNVPQACQQSDCRFGALFEITLERPMYTVPLTDQTPYDTTSELYQTFTSPERGIESDDPKLRELAQEIVGDEASPYKQVLLIQSWVKLNIRYPDLSSTYPDDALLCIDQGVGDCAGQSKVFVALCRALGIPARTVSGLRPFQAGVGRLDQFGPRAAWFERTLDVHVWVEIYLPALGWVQGEADVPGFGIDKERLITKRGPLAFPGGLCRHATYLHLPLAVQGDWCGQSVGWEVSIDAQPID